jgi:hypothetical protein
MRINWLAILVTVIVQLAIGFLWYSPALFAESWLAGIGRRPEDLAPGAGPFIIALLAAVLLALGIAWVLHRADLRGIRAGTLVGMWLGVAFVVPPVLVHEAFLGYPATVLAIDGGKELITAVLAGAILGAWAPR